MNVTSSIRYAGAGNINQGVGCDVNVHRSVSPVGISCRRLLPDSHDGLYRLAASRFDRMLHNHGVDRLPCFAGKRVRMAEVLVELIQRDPVRVMRLTFNMLTFDSHGHLLPDAFLQQRVAVAVGATAAALAPDHRDPIVLQVESPVYRARRALDTVRDS